MPISDVTRIIAISESGTALSLLGVEEGTRCSKMRGRIRVVIRAVMRAVIRAVMRVVIRAVMRVVIRDVIRGRCRSCSCGVWGTTSGFRLSGPTSWATVEREREKREMG